jgi:hypothetical protein
VIVIRNRRGVFSCFREKANGELNLMNNKIQGMPREGRTPCIPPDSV